MDKVKKIPIIGRLFDYVLIIIGCLFAAFAIECILVPNTILDGGVNGISIILNKTFNFNLGFTIFLINIPFLLIGFKNLGKKFLFKSILSILLFSILIEVFGHIGYVLTEDILLATIYGSSLLGVGVGLVIRSGACLDGTESLGLVISKNTNISVGQFVLCCNAIIFSIAATIFGVDRALLSLLAYFITSKLVDEISEGLDQGKAAMIICNDGSKMAQHIYNSIGRTCTMLRGNGLISGEKAVLYCVITRIEINSLKKIVMDEDQSAFITITDVSEIIGDHIKSNKKLKRRRKSTKNGD